MTTLYAYQGKNFTENAVFLNDSGTPINVAGHTSYLKIAKYYGASEDTLTVNGTIVAPSTSGVFSYSATKENILTLQYGKHVYTRYLVDSLGNVVNVSSGDFVIIPSVL